MFNDRLGTKLPDCPPDAVLLDESSYSTDIHEFIKCLIRQGVDEAEFRPRIVQWVADSLDHATKRARKKSAMEYLKTPKRTFERWLEIHFMRGTDAVPKETPRKKGKHLLTQTWESFIKETWEKGSTNGKIMSAAAVHGKVEREALNKRNIDEYPHYTTVLRIVKPLIEQRKIKEGIYSAGQGSESIVKTRGGKGLRAIYPNKVVQIDHTKIDVFSVYEDGEVVPYIKRVEDDKVSPAKGTIRLYLSILKDIYSKCILGHLLSAKQPGSEEVALLIRWAILPKHFPFDYDLRDVNIPYGFFRHLHTDRGRDLTAKHIKEIGEQLTKISPEIGFTCHQREQPSDGGDAESVFNGLNHQVWRECPGYTGSNVKKRPKNAESRACLTSRDIDKLVSWHFYGVYNNDNHPKFKTRTRYQVWLDGLDGELPPVMDGRKLDICLMKVVTAKIYKHGSVRFMTRRYRGEALKGINSASVTLRYNPDNILRLLAFEKETDEKPGKFLGYVDMLDVYELNNWIDELDLNIKKINLKKIEAETLSLDELNEVRNAVNAKAREVKNSTKYTRAKYGGKKDDLIAEKGKGGSRRQQNKEHRRLRSYAKASSCPANSEPETIDSGIISDARADSAMPRSTQSVFETSEFIQEPISKAPSVVEQANDLDASQAIIKTPEPRKVISMQERLQENNVEFFSKQLKSSEAERPKLIVPRRTGRFR
jgi:putative transposase